MKKIVLTPNPYRDRNFKYVTLADKLLREAGLETRICLAFDVDRSFELPDNVVLTELNHELRDADLLVCFGGDGTILHASKAATKAGIPVLGVNIGTMGFMAELESSELKELRRLADDDFSVEPRMMLHVRAEHEGRVILEEDALNDAVITKGAVARVVQMSVQGDGVDMMSFGGTKNGMMMAESVVVFNKDFVRDFVTLRKQNLQLASKMRFLAAQYIAYFKDGLWLENARHANNMARLLADLISGMPHVELAHPVESNGVFVNMKPEHIAALQRQYMFHEVEPSAHTVRWMLSFNTSEEQVRAFAKAIGALALNPFTGSLRKPFGTSPKGFSFCGRAEEEPPREPVRFWWSALRCVGRGKTCKGSGKVVFERHGGIGGELLGRRASFSQACRRGAPPLFLNFYFYRKPCPQPFEEPDTI